MADLTTPMRHMVASLLAAPLAACGSMTPIGGAGERIVSIDYCADQAVLDLVPHDRIAAVSIETEPGQSIAPGIDHVRAEAESILALRPTLVVRSYGGGPRLAAALARAGVRTYTLPYADGLDDVEPHLLATGVALGGEQRARQLAHRWRRSLDRARAAPRLNGTALYLTPGDVTTGPDSFVAQMMVAAGYRIYDGRRGWNRLPLEAMALRPPRRLVRAFFDAKRYQQDAWSSAAHDRVAALNASIPSVELSGAEVACSNWRSAAAIDRLVASGTRHP